ncbi:hypothetical protein ACHAXS_001089, partial [Conticribra weissflogii]
SLRGPVKDDQTWKLQPETTSNNQSSAATHAVTVRESHRMPTLVVVVVILVVVVLCSPWHGMVWLQHAWQSGLGGRCSSQRVARQWEKYACIQYQ